MRTWDIVCVAIHEGGDRMGIKRIAADKPVGTQLPGALVNASSNLQRRRYTVGHDLGHFLNPWHRPTSPDGFWYSREDMTRRESMVQDRHRRQEAEANTFAIELLTPRKRLRRYLAGTPDLERMLEMATAFDISRLESVRRYVSLYSDHLASIFSKEGRFRYADPTTGFPWLSLRKDNLMPELPKPGGADLLSSIEEADPADWLERPTNASLTVQTLHQKAGSQSPCWAPMPALRSPADRTIDL